MSTSGSGARSKPSARTPGGPSRWWSSSASPPSSSTRRGPPSKGEQLRRSGPYHLTVLLPGALRRFTACSWFGPKPDVVPRLDAVVARVLDPLGAGRLPADLLLLSRRLLQGVLGRPSVLQRRRAIASRTAVRTRACRSSCRTSIAISSISPLAFIVFLASRRLEGALVRGRRNGPDDLNSASGGHDLVLAAQRGRSSEATPWVVTRCATSSAAPSIELSGSAPARQVKAYQLRQHV